MSWRKKLVHYFVFAAFLTALVFAAPVSISAIWTVTLLANEAIRIRMGVTLRPDEAVPFVVGAPVLSFFLLVMTATLLAGRVVAQAVLVLAGEDD